MSARLDRDAKKAAQTLKTARDYMTAGKTAEAETACRLFIQMNPGNTAAMLDLGLMLMAKQPDEAGRLFGAIIAQDPRNANALVALARLRMERGLRDDALALADRAKSLPLPAPVWNRLGVLYREAGLNENAAECFTAAISRQPDFIAAYHALGQLKKISADGAKFKALQDMHGHADRMAPQPRSVLEYTLARAWLETGDDDRAFAHYAVAHELRKAGSKYSADTFDHYINTVISLFNDTAPGTSTSEQPIFIVGLPRSGSTLIDQILCSHPDVKGVGEAAFLQESMPFYPNAEAPDSAGAGIPTIGKMFRDNLTPAALDGIAKKYLSLTDTGAPRVTDKMLFNYLWIGVILRAFPQAKVIHCTRDALDCGLSIWQTFFSEGLMPWANDLGDIGRYIRSYQKLMAHWEKLFPGKIYTANYEAMIADQENGTRKLLEYCGLPWNEACLSFHKTERLVKTASASQVRQPLYGDSVGKGRAYARHLAPLIHALDS